VNTVLIPGINDAHMAEVARRVKDWGALILNVIPLIPSGTFAGFAEPTCNDLAAARAAAEAELPVFKHCRHCRADACGIPGKSDVSAELYAGQGLQPVLDGWQTFSHG
jgi:nitrogen fixation protein NifB